jgi:excisionase family DNA binding protein
LAGLLSPFVEDATPATIVRALAQYDANGAGSPQKPADRRGISIREYALAWDVSDDTVRRLIKAKRIFALRIGTQIRIPIEALPGGAATTPGDEAKA